MDEIQKDINEKLDEIIDERINRLSIPEYLGNGFKISDKARQELRNKITHMVADHREQIYIQNIIVSYLKGYHLGLQE